MAASAASTSACAAMAAIPRFLLPRRGPLWQSTSAFAVQVPAAGLLRRANGRPAQLLPPQAAANPLSRCAAAAVRQASSTAKPGSKASRRTSSRVVPAPTPKPAPKKAPTPAPASSPTPAAPTPSNILEKPAKFNPPSHGSRLPRQGAGIRSSQHYGGELSEAEQAAQKLRQYPGLMSPPGTWSHWFWNSRTVHLSITMTTLTALALWTFFENFRRTSPYVDMLPTGEEARAHPIQAVRTAIEVVRLTEQQRSLEIAERRQQRIDDVAKRTMYRKAHGLDETVGFASTGGWFAGKKEPEAPQRNEVPDDQSPIRGPTPSGEVVQVVQEAETSAAAAAIASTTDETGKRKKYLGIF